MPMRIIWRNVVTYSDIKSPEWVVVIKPKVVNIVYSVDVNNVDIIISFYISEMCVATSEHK